MNGPTLAFPNLPSQAFPSKILEALNRKEAQANRARNSDRKEAKTNGAGTQRSSREMKE